MSRNVAIIIGIIIIAIIILLGISAINTTQTPGLNSISTSQNSTNTTATTSQTVTVTYDGTGFSPQTVTINRGDTVVFSDTSSSTSMWVASDPHPLHNGYPTTGGCVASTFDSCQNLSPGQTFPFVFTFTGSWGYHNHLNPSQKGTVVVR